MEDPTVFPDWKEILKEESEKEYFLHLKKFIREEYLSSTPVYPPKELIFNAFCQTSFEKTKVVIVGQDPYHGKSQAHGLSFSVPHGISPPPSLKNIFKELQEDLCIPMPAHGCLTSWAQQGVLLLNAVLTVKEGQPLSHHKRGWERWTSAVVEILATKKETPVVFVLWGKSAQEKCLFLETASFHSKHYVLKAPHPSPFSAHTGFFGCRHFSKINAFLVKTGQSPIDWSI